MSPDEVIFALEKLSIKMTRRTLLNYETWGLIPEAKRGGYGRGKGTFTDYPAEALFDAYAAWSLLNGKQTKLRVDTVKRAKGLHEAETQEGDFPQPTDYCLNARIEWTEAIHWADEWAKARRFAKLGIPVNANVIFLCFTKDVDFSIHEVVLETQVVKEYPDLDVYFVIIDQRIKSTISVFIAKYNGDSKEVDVLWSEPIVHSKLPW